MAVLQNIIKSIFTVEGADAAARNNDRFGRSQTRLGQSSASAARSFAAQSQGLGGLVAAYAGAAATTFALEAAFRGLANSARAIQTLEGLTALAASTAQDGQKIVNSIRDITNAQLTLVESAELANLSLSAGFNSDQIEGLSSVALKASRALGRDLTDAFTRVVRGSAKMETELLDELGIYTKIAPAVSAYASATGKAVGELSEFERRQAFVNSVIAEGERKYQAINTEVPTASEKIEAFGAKIRDITTVIGSFIANALVPLADFLTNNVGATIGALGLGASLVLGKTLDVINGKITDFEKSIEARSARATAFIQKFNKEAARAGQDAVKNLNLSRSGLTAESQKELSDLRTQASVRNLSNSELQRTNDLLAARDAKLKTSRKTLLDTAKAQRALAADTNATAVARAQANAELVRAQKQLARLRTVQQATTASMQALTAATTGAAGSFALFASKVAAGALALGANVAKAALNIVSFAGSALQAAAVLGIVVTAVANASGKSEELSAIFSNLGKSIKGFLTGGTAPLESVFLGAGSSALRDLEAVNNELRDIQDFTYNSVFLGVDIEITKTKEELVSEVSTILTEAATAGEESFGESLTSGLALTLGTLGAILGTPFGGVFGTVAGAAAGAALGASLDQLWQYYISDLEVSPEDAARLTNKFGESLTVAGEETKDKLLKALLAVEDKYGAASTADPAAKAALKLQQELIVSSAEVLENVSAIAEIIKITGQSSTNIIGNFDFALDPTSVNKAITDATTAIGNQTITFKFFDIDQEAVQSVLQDSINIGDVNAANLTNDLTNKLKSNFSSLDTSRITPFLETLYKVRDAADETEASLILLTESDAYDFTNYINNTNDWFNSIKNIANELQIAAPIVSNISDLFINFSGSINTATSQAFKSVEVLRIVDEGIKNSAISLEQFDQQVQSAKSAIVASELEQVNIISSRINLEAEYSRIASSDAKNKEDQLSKLRALIDSENSRADTLRNETLPAANAILERIEAQREALKEQLTLQEFLDDLDAKRVNKYQTTFDLIKATGKSTAETLGVIAAANRDQGQAYNDGVAASKEQLSVLKLTDSATQAILQTSIDNAEDRLSVIKNIENVTDAQLSKDGKSLLILQEQQNAAGGLETVYARINLQTGETVRNGELYNGVLEAQKATNTEIVASLIEVLMTSEKLISAYDDQVAQSKAALEVAIARAQAEANITKAVTAADSRSRRIDNLKAEIGLLQTKLDTEEVIAANTIASNQLEQQNAENRLDILQAEQAQINSNAESYNAVIKSVTSLSVIMAKLSSPMDDSAESRAERARASVSASLAVAEQEFAIRAETIRHEMAQLEARRAIEVEIASKKEAILSSELDAVKAREASQAELIQKEVDLAKLQRENSLASLRDQKNALSDRIAVLQKETDLENQKIQISSDADKKKALADTDYIANYLNAIKTQEDVNTAFISSFSSAISELSKTLGKGDISPIAIPDAGLDIEGMLGELQAYRNSVSGVFDGIASDSIAANNAMANSSRDRMLAEKADLAIRIANMENYNQKALEADRALADARIATLSNETEKAQNAYDTFLEQRKSSDADYASEKLALESALAQASINYAAEVANKIAELQSAATSQIASWTQQAQSYMADVQRIAEEETIAQLRFEIDMADLENQLQMVREQAKLTALEQQVELVAAKEANKSISPTDAATETNRLQQEILNQQENILQQQISAADASYTQQVALIQAESQLAKERIAAEAKLAQQQIDAEYAVLQAQAQTLEAHVNGMGDVANGFLTGMASVANSLLGGLATTLQSFVTAFASIKMDPETGAFSGGGSVTAGTVEASFEKITTDISATVTKIGADLSASYDTVSDALVEQTTARIEAEAAAENRALERLAKEKEIADANFADRQAQSAMERQIEDENAKKRLADAAAAGGAGKAGKKAAEEAKKAFEEAKSAILAIFDAVQGPIQDALMSLNDLIFYGEGDFGEIISNMLKSIQQNLFQELIAKPLSSYLTDTLLKPIFGAGRKGIENAKIDPDGALVVRIADKLDFFGVNNADGSTTLGDKAASDTGMFGGVFDGLKQQFTGLFGQGGFLSTLFNGLFGQGGIFAMILRGLSQLLQSLFSGVGGGGGFLGGIFSAITGGGAAKASGGIVHMAQGGMLGASALKRDRVKTMLEPGEFVMRKAATRAIGVGNLQQMNATGKASGDVQVNITNNGTPQEASASTPRFDGEKYVIDIVTRDLANNGPIRRSIRGGSL